LLLLAQIAIANPASAALSERCFDLSLANGVTMRSCISADLQRVHGQTRVLFTPAALSAYSGSLIETTAAIRVYKNNVFEQDTGTKTCDDFITPAKSTYACVSFDAINADQRQYQELGSASIENGPSSFIFGFKVDP
jgi:hypothetical protein